MVKGGNLYTIYKAKSVCLKLLNLDFGRYGAEKTAPIK